MNDLMQDLEHVVAIANENAKRLDEAKAEIERLREENAEWKHRAIGGTCRILSKGDGCSCSLCARDREIERLRTVVGKLPKTADDVPVVFGMSVYGRWKGKGEVLHIHADGVEVLQPGGVFWRDYTDMWSTPEAALASTGGEPTEEG